jgi:hypothetical protein
MFLSKKYKTNWPFIFIIFVLGSILAEGIFWFGSVEEFPTVNPAVIINRSKPPEYLKFFEQVKEKMISDKTDFLEANLEDMKVRFFNDGVMQEEFSILRKGDIQRWGGSPVGLNKILSGNKLSFSIVAQAYMPYALHFYGKYYIHGEPYYPSGELINSSVSGGCISLSNKAAESIFELSEIDMPFLIIDKNRVQSDYTQKTTSEFPKISAESYLVADLDSGYIFSQKNYEKEFSTELAAKLILPIVVSENINLYNSILVKETMLKKNNIKELEAGRYFRPVEMFYPLLLSSSGDPAEVLSYFLGKEKTIKMMNEKAAAALMGQTKIVDPSGGDSENISTAKDLFYLGRYVLNNRPLIFDITKGKRVVSFGEIDFEIKDLLKKNIFIDEVGFIGGQTDSKNGLFLFNFSGQNVIKNIAVVVLNSEVAENDGKEIYDWVKKNYFDIEIN